MRPYFPEALYFTTDLDARLMAPDQNAWTRNLIIASPYGLSLIEDLQCESLPFRSSYQTAIYYSALNALKAIDVNRRDKVPVPRLFEIGRMGEYDFSSKDTTNVQPCAPGFSA